MLVNKAREVYVILAVNENKSAEGMWFDVSNGTALHEKNEARWYVTLNGTHFILVRDSDIASLWVGNQS